MIKCSACISTISLKTYTFLILKRRSYSCSLISLSIVQWFSKLNNALSQSYAMLLYKIFQQWYEVRKKLKCLKKEKMNLKEIFIFKKCELDSSGPLCDETMKIFFVFGGNTSIFLIIQLQTLQSWNGRKEDLYSFNPLTLRIVRSGLRMGT